MFNIGIDFVKKLSVHLLSNSKANKINPAIDHINMKKKLPGVLMRSQASVFGDKVFYVNKGGRYWVRDGEWLARNGFDWSKDVKDVPPDYIYTYVNRGIAPIYTREDLSRNPTSSVEMREIAASKLKGNGVEFGAGASPFPVPIDCKVRYGDAFSYSALKAGIYPGQEAYDLIDPDYLTDIKTLSGIPDESLDFIIACHVIEHTNNPIAAFEASHRALRIGGSFVLVVPDMHKTFDSKRQLTTLEHLKLDFDSPSKHRDLEHYIEFYTKAFDIPEGSNVLEYSKQKQTEHGDLHYHTWNYETFGELVEWCAINQGWMVDFKHDTLPGNDNIEFYYVITKVSK